MPLLSNTLADSIDLAAFTAADFTGRVAMIYARQGHRTDSSALSMAWYGIYQRASKAGVPPQIRSQLLMDTIRLNPLSPLATLCLDLLLEERPTHLQTPRYKPEPIIYTIISCEKNLDKAHQLRRDISQTGALATIVVGRPALRHFELSNEILFVPSEDTYEALPDKVLKAILALKLLYGRFALVKLDDDVSVADATKVARFKQLALPHYCGVMVNPVDFDRCWHVGKCSTFLPPVTDRYHGPWIQGGTYLIDSRAVVEILNEYLRYPNEFSKHVLEDKMIGDTLRSRNVMPVDLDIRHLFGLALDTSEKPLR